MRSLYIIGVLLLLSIGVIAQNHGSVGGTITSADGSPAEFVNVALKGTAKGAIADRRGRFVIAPVAPGKYTVIASFVGLETQEREVEIVAGQRMVVDFT